MQNRLFLGGALFFGMILNCALLSCTRETDLLPEGRAQVIVVCVLTEESQQVLTLGVTDIATLEEKEVLSRADITLFDTSIEEEIGRFHNTGTNEWTLDYAAVPEHSYQLKIDIPGREEISASTRMPAKSKIEYRMNMYREDQELGIQYLIRTLPQSPVWMMGMVYNPDKEKHEVASRIATSLLSVSPQNVTDNIFCLDEFCDESVLRMLSLFLPEYESGETGFYRYVEGRPLFDRMFRIPSVGEMERKAIDEPSGCFSVAGDFFRKRSDIGEDFFSIRSMQEHKNASYIVALSLSEEYDKYLQELISKKTQEAHYSSLFSRENAYTNIINGVGVFGAKTEQHLPWNDYVIVTGGF